MEVRINGILAELGNSMPAISKPSFDLEKPATRFLSTTNSFTLPSTYTNREIFRNPAKINNNGDAMDRLYNIEISDVFKIFEGVCYVVSSNKDTIKIQALDGAKSLFDSFKVKLRDLLFDDQDTELTTTAIDSLRSVDIDSIHYWGKACYHEQALQINTDQTTGDARCKYSRPTYYINALMKRVCGDYSYAPSDLELCISSNHTDFFFTNYQKQVDELFEVTGGTLLIDGLNTNDISLDITSSSTSLDVGSQTISFRIRGDVTTTGGQSLIVRSTDQVDPTKIQEYKVTLENGFLDFLTGEFQSDDSLDIEFEVVGNGDFEFDGLIYSVISEKTRDLSTNPFLGYKIKAYENLPDYTYMDLFKTICVLSNGYHDVSFKDKSFGFKSFSRVGKLSAVDWSDKFIIGSETITSEIKAVSQLNRLTYSNDETVEKQLGWHFFTNSNNSLPSESVYMSLPFGASSTVSIDGDALAHMRVYNDTMRVADRDLSPRLFVASGDALLFDPIGWVSSSENYSGLFSALGRIRVVDCLVDLSKLDFLSWNQTQLVYIDYFDSTFMVLDIGDFIPRKLTKVKLLKYV